MLELHAVPWIKMKPGAGPRHLAFHPGGRFAYLVNELDSTVAALAYDGAGAFGHLQTVATLPDGFGGASTCADIQVSPSGTFVYTSNRGHDSIVVHRIDPLAGTLGYVGHASTLGRTPRSFGIDPSGRFLLAANQDSDTVVTLPHRRRHRRANAHRPRRVGADAGVREVPGSPARVIRVRRRGGPPGGHASALSRATR